MTNNYKLLFFITLVSGTLITLSSYSWVGMWMGLEINLLSMIPLINNSKNLMASESSIKYFITQAIASSILLYMMLLMSIMETYELSIINESIIITLNSSLFLKMGAAPLHFWFPEILEGLNWLNSLIMMTWQKIAPSIILINSVKNMNLMYLFIFTSLLMGGILGINQVTMRKILAYSSINHLGWMLSTMTINITTWMNYFLIYSIISLNLILILKTSNIFLMSQIFSLKNNNLKMSFLINLMSMGGVPPFLGFFPKWMTINELTNHNLPLSITMVILTLITLFMYIRTLLPSITLNTAETKISLSPNSNFLIWVMNWFNLLSLSACTLWFNL